MKQLLILLQLMIILAVACVGAPSLNIQATVQVAILATQTSLAAGSSGLIPTATLALIHPSLTPTVTPTQIRTITPSPINLPSIQPTISPTPDFSALLSRASQLCSESLTSANPPPAPDIHPGPALVLYNAPASTSWNIAYARDFIQEIPIARNPSEVKTLVCFKSTIRADDSYIPAADEVTWYIRVIDLQSGMTIGTTTLIGQTYSDYGGFPRYDLKPQVGRFLAHIWGKDVLPYFYLNGENIAKVAFSQDSQFVLAAAEGYSGYSPIRMWDLHTWQPVISYTLSVLAQGDVYDPCSVDFSRDGSQLAVSDYPEHVNLLDFATGELLLRFKHGPYTWEYASINCAALSPDANYIAGASTGGENRVKIWDTTTGQQVSDISFDPKEVPFYQPNLVFSPDGSLLAIASGSFELSKVQDQPLILWDISSNRKLATLTIPSDGPVSVAFSQDGRLLAAYSDHEGIILWDLLTFEKIRTFRPQTAGEWERQGHGLAFSSDGELLACGIVGGVQLFDVATGELLQTLDGPLPNTSVITVAFSPDDTMVAAGTTVQHVPLSYYGGQGTVWVWEVNK